MNCPDHCAFLSVVLQETLKELLNFFVINCTVVRAIHKTNCLRNFRLLIWVLNSPTAYLFSNCGADFHWGMLFRRVPLWETVSIVLAGQLWGNLKCKAWSTRDKGGYRDLIQILFYKSMFIYQNLWLGVAGNIIVHENCTQSPLPVFLEVETKQNK